MATVVLERVIYFLASASSSSFSVAIAVLLTLKSRIQVEIGNIRKEMLRKFMKMHSQVAVFLLE